MTQEIYKFRADARATRVLKDPCFNHLLSELREVWEVLGTREAIQWVGSLSDFRTETVFQPVWKYVSILTISVHISDWILSWCFTWGVCPGFQIPKYYSELESVTVLILRDFFYAFSAISSLWIAESWFVSSSSSSFFFFMADLGWSCFPAQVLRGSIITGLVKPSARSFPVWLLMETTVEALTLS